MEDNDIFGTYMTGVAKAAVKEVLADKFPSLTESQLDDLTKIVIYRNNLLKYKTRDAVLAAKLGSLAFTNKNSVARKIFVPFKKEGSKVIPLVSQERLNSYMSGISSLDSYFANNSLPSNLNLDSFSWHILDTSDKFAKFYKALGAKKSEKYIRESILGANSLNLGSGKSTIIFNPELQSSSEIEKNGRFGGQDGFAETVIHEFGHSLHRSISLLFGRSGAAREEFNRDYKEIKKQFVSEYGNQDFEEHFSEAFSKYLSSGEATPEFKQFLQKYIHNRPAQAQQSQPQAQTESNLGG